MKHGCHVELFNLPDDEGPDDCVLNYGDKGACIYARNIDKPESCKYWLPITPENDRKHRFGDDEE